MKLQKFLDSIPNDVLDIDYYLDSISFFKDNTVVLFLGKQPYLSKYNEEHKTVIEFKIDPSIDNEFFSYPINGIELIKITNFREVCVHTKTKSYSLT